MSDDDLSRQTLPSKRVQTLDVLRSLGFATADEFGEAALVFDFGNLKLHATRCVNRWFVDVVKLFGIYTGPRLSSYHELDHEFPAEEASREMVLAHIAWAVDQVAPHKPKNFEPLVDVPWLDEGRANLHLLPWVRDRIRRQEEQARFTARPHCDVEREWARVGIATLVKFGAAFTSALVVVHFDGAVVQFRAEGLSCAMPAQGGVWPVPVTISSDGLKGLKQRLTPFVTIGVWEGKLEVGRVRIALINEPGNERNDCTVAPVGQSGILGTEVVCSEGDPEP